MENRKTILICDDEPALRELIRASLDDGYLFAEASDGVTALELAREVEPDLVVLERLRADPLLRQVPVLVITAWNETREDVIAAGAAEFASKPFDPDVLRASIERILDAA